MQGKPLDEQKLELEQLPWISKLGYDQQLEDNFLALLIRCQSECMKDQHCELPNISKTNDEYSWTSNQVIWKTNEQQMC